MLMNDFYTVHDIQPGDNTASCLVVFHKSHQIFEGHFPGQPVVPGVCMMQIVKELLQRQLGKTLMLEAAGQVKFLRLITPDVTPDVLLNWKETETGYTATATFRKDGDLFKFSGAFGVM